MDDNGLPDPERTLTHTRVVSDPSRREAPVGPYTPGTVLADRYRIVAPLGSGGVGDVYRAEDTKLGQTVALKFITQRIAHEKQLLERIIAEVRIGRQVSHPNLCRIYDLSEVGNQYFITMEYVDGENLASLLLRVGRLPEDKALQVGREICAGLAAAHDRGVVHRDMKPANVMIDGRGRARITDFGLAIVPGEGIAESFAGTPAYMAPEQLDGAEATEQSDIYGLGLVLYEIFTGQRFYSGTLTEISNAHRVPKRPPSTIVRGLTPSIERVILQCIEENPSDRPESVRDVLAALPGGDALRIAIDAGETPTPRAVAAAERIGELPLSVAWASIALMMVLIVALGVASRYTQLYMQAPLSMSPDVLTDRARQIIRTAGYEPRPYGSRRWMSNDLNALRVGTESGPSLDDSRAFHRLSPLRLGYRESPQPLVPLGRGAMVTASDPPLDVPGMVTIVLDSAGKLVRFVRVPTVSDQGSGGSAAVNWDAFIEFAHLDKKMLRAGPSTWISPVDNDGKSSWTGTMRGDPLLKVDVHAAQRAGRPVFFEVALQPHHAPEQPRSRSKTATATEEFSGVTGFAMVFLAGLVLAAPVARRNLQLGRGDRGAARKLSLLVFGSLLIAGLLSADHTSDLAGEWGLLVGIAGNALYHAGAIWLFYIAAEPYVRRRQPELLISWNRVLRGYFRDALVARDVLIGCVLGAILNLFYNHLLVLVPAWLGMSAPVPGHAFPEKLGGGVWPFVSLLSLLGGVPRDSVMALFMFSATRSVFRRDWLAAAALILLSIIPHTGRDVAFMAEAPFALCAAAVFVFALCRVGLLAGMVTLFVGSWFSKSLFVFDTRSWLFGPSLIYVGVTLALAFYGFRYSLGSKALLGRVRLAE